MATFRKIAVYTLPHQAQLAKAYLESHDIPAFVKDDQISNTYGGLSLGFGGAKLMVPEEQAEEAIELLNKAPEFKMEELPWDEDQTDPETGKVLPKEEPIQSAYSRSRMWILMPFIAAALLLIIWIIVYLGGSAVINFFKETLGLGA